MRNTAIKHFDMQLANTINSALEQGVEISTVILALDKYLFNARAIETQILEREQLNAEMEKFRNSTTEGSNINATLDEFATTSDD